VAKIAAVILAAGRSSRWRAEGGGGETKLTATLAGKPIVRRVAEAALASRARPAVVVVGHAREAVASALQGLAVTFAVNADFASGIASSLRTGLNAAPADVDGAIILLGDMPHVGARLIDALITEFESCSNPRAVAPVQNGRRGNPALIGRALFACAARLEGDEGARRLIGALGSHELVEVDATEWNATFDVDTPADLAGASQVGKQRRAAGPAECS
jgi:molybdenum cofactor cytidylyltransferase